MTRDLILCIGGHQDGKLLPRKVMRQERVIFALPVSLPAVPWSAWDAEQRTTMNDIPRETYLRHQVRGEHETFELLVEESISADQMLQRLLDTYAVHVGEKDMMGRLVFGR